jgi:hypothetical protein
MVRYQLRMSLDKLIIRWPIRDRFSPGANDEKIGYLMIIARIEALISARRAKSRF